ncbi:ABC transporter ATP-binding protein [Desulfobacter sp.]|uniref:ABC transporter ATP-binding protein n=1 Tax=Desulfobacter sp. TaxID=2294 RepID=UPI003D0C576B
MENLKPTNGAEAAVRLSGVDKSFQIGDQITPILKQVDFTALVGEMIFVVGPSGCGKTTLLSVLCGTLNVEAGEVYVLGHPLHKLSASAVTRFRSRNVGFIFQQFNLFPTLTVAENVAIPLRIQGIPGPKASVRAKEMLARVGISEKANERPARPCNIFSLHRSFWNEVIYVNGPAQIFYLGRAFRYCSRHFHGPSNHDRSACTTAACPGCTKTHKPCHCCRRPGRSFVPEYKCCCACVCPDQRNFCKRMGYS